MVDRITRGTGRRAAIAAAFLLTIVPACQGGGLGLLRPRGERQAMRPTPAVVPYSAYRPAYSPAPPRRTLFLGGYAGYVYGPVRPRGYVPTSHGVEVWGSPVSIHDRAPHGSR